MIQDARQAPDGSRFETDLAVVGAGAAGITIARALAGAPFRICLVESGGLEPDDRTQALAAAENVGLPYGPVEATRLRYFGGTTNHWGGWCRPLDALDFERRDWVPLSGWPIGRADLDAYYPEASRICEAGRFAYDDVAYWEGRLGLQGSGLPDSGIVRRVIQFSPPTRFGARYRGELERASNLLVLLNANVVEIRTTDDAAEVTGLSLATLDGKRHTLAAKLCVLAAGGIENARLLLLSNGIRPAGLGNAQDMVGRCFMEHPHVYSMASILTPDASGISPLALEEQEADGIGLRGNFMPAEDLQRRERLQNATFTIGIAARYPSRDAIPPTAPALAAPLLDLLHEGGAPSGDFGARIGVGGAGEQRPNRDSRVTLSDRGDALGLPLARLDWRLAPEDKASLVRNLRALGGAFAAAGLGRMHIELPPGEAWPAELTGGNHHMGTTRMSADPREGVVDADCRVHGMANLYVAGSSVFPTCGAANPTLTIVALALRLADHLRRRTG